MRSGGSRAVLREARRQGRLLRPLLRRRSRDRRVDGWDHAHVVVEVSLLECARGDLERFFERHGGKAVFFARFFGGVRVTGAWMAGITRMSWWRFLFWNALGGI